MNNSHIVIIGSGIAGFTMLRQLRALNNLVPITVITQDCGNYYYKPTLSNALKQKLKPEDLILAPTCEIEKKYNVRYLTQTLVTNICTKRDIVTTSQGDIPYSHLILALGASPIRLPNQQSMLSINNFNDFRNYHALLQSTKHVAIVGAGFVGCEFAFDLAMCGYQVSIFYREDLPLPALEMADREKVQLYFKQKNINHYPNTEFSSDSHIAYDLVISAIGIRPDLELAKKAYIHTNKGIIVNEFCQTNYSNIYALGDCAELSSRVLQFVAPINSFAKAIAQSILIRKTPIELPKLVVKVKIPELAISYRMV